MTYTANCCGVTVIGRLVWIALAVSAPEEVCPACGKWTKFTAVTAAPAEKKLVFGEKAA